MRPEEKVRQALLGILVEQLGYPKNLIAVEKELASLPHVDGDAPKRRLDILVYAKKEKKLQPLLLIECKATHVTDKAMQQALGYNEVVGAPFVAVVGRRMALTAKSNGEMVGGLMPYQELVKWS